MVLTTNILARPASRMSHECQQLSNLPSNTSKSPTDSPERSKFVGSNSFASSKKMSRVPSTTMYMPVSPDSPVQNNTSWGASRTCRTDRRSKRQSADHMLLANYSMADNTSTLHWRLPGGHIPLWSSQRVAETPSNPSRQRILSSRGSLGLPSCTTPRHIVGYKQATLVQTQTCGNSCSGHTCCPHFRGLCCSVHLLLTAKLRIGLRGLVMLTKKLVC
jgi:hypothetical protein